MVPVSVSVPCVGAVTMAMEVNTPDMLPDKLMIAGLLNDTVTAKVVSTGTGGAATVIVAVAGAVVPPVPVAV